MNCENLTRPQSKPNPNCTLKSIQIRWMSQKKHLALEFFKIGSVGNMVWTRSCQDRVRFLIPSWTATWKLIETDLTAGFGERFKTVTDRCCFAVYRYCLHDVINALKFKVKFFWERKNMLAIFRSLLLTLHRCWRQKICVVSFIF